MLRESLNRIADLEWCLFASMSAGAPRSEKPASGMAETDMLRGRSRDSGGRTRSYDVEMGV